MPGASRPHQKFVHERIQVRSSRQNQAFFGLIDVRGGNRFAHGNAHFFDDFPGQGVDEPRLSPRDIEGAFDRFGQKHLTRFGRMLPIQRRNFVRRQVAQAHRRELDIERTRCTEAIWITARRSLVVAHIA